MPNMWSSRCWLISLSEQGFLTLLLFELLLIFFVFYSFVIRFVVFFSFHSEYLLLCLCKKHSAISGFTAIEMEPISWQNVLTSQFASIKTKDDVNETKKSLEKLWYFVEVETASRYGTSLNWISYSKVWWSHRVKKKALKDLENSQNVMTVERV